MGFKKKNFTLSNTNYKLQKNEGINTQQCNWGARLALFKLILILNRERYPQSLKIKYIYIYLTVLRNATSTQYTLYKI